MWICTSGGRSRGPVADGGRHGGEVNTDSEGLAMKLEDTMRWPQPPVPRCTERPHAGLCRTT